MGSLDRARAKSPGFSTAKVNELYLLENQLGQHLGFWINGDAEFCVYQLAAAATEGSGAVKQQVAVGAWVVKRISDCLYHMRLSWQVRRPQRQVNQVQRLLLLPWLDPYRQTHWFAGILNASQPA